MESFLTLVQGLFVIYGIIICKAEAAIDDRSNIDDVDVASLPKDFQQYFTLLEGRLQDQFESKLNHQLEVRDQRLKEELNYDFQIKLQQRLDEQALFFTLQLQEKQIAIDKLTRKLDLISASEREMSDLGEIKKTLLLQDNMETKSDNKNDRRRTSSSNQQSKEKETTNRNAYQQSGAFVGFMAAASENRLYEQGQRIIYDVIHMDPSNNYNATSGAFVCPYSGYYQFTVTVGNTPIDGVNERTDAALYIGETSIMKAIASKLSMGIVQSSVTDVYRCEANEEVYIVQSMNSFARGVFGDSHSGFSGYLIRMDTI